MGDETLLKFGLTAFTTLLVVVDPFGVLPIFVSLTRRRPAHERPTILARAVGIAFAISLFFLLAGHGALAYLGVSVQAFGISGGILLFATAMPMLFGQRPALQSHEGGDAQPDADDDISIFPLAIPLLAGPGTITSILVLTSQAEGNMPKLLLVGGALAVVFGITYLVLGVAGHWLVHRLGSGGLHIATRVLGILLAALAVQFVLNGLSDYIRLFLWRTPPQ